MVGPVVKGTQKVLFQAPAPDIKNIPPNDVLGVTVCLLTVHYKNNEFVRVGYYVNIEYDEEELRTNPPETIQIERLQRNILAEKPRVTRWAIQWDD
jgi:histone chaperone ASF1